MLNSWCSLIRSGLERSILASTSKEIFSSNIKSTNSSSILIPIRHRFYDPDKVKFRDYGYEDKMTWRGRLPRIPRESIKRVPEKPYAPINSWSEKKALFGQNDYIDILGSSSIHPVQIQYGVPYWLKGFQGNELQMLIRKRKIFGYQLKASNPDSFHNMRKRIRFLRTALNRKRKVRFGFNDD